MKSIIPSDYGSHLFLHKTTTTVCDTPIGVWLQKTLFPTTPSSPSYFPFLDILSQLFNHIKCVYQQRNQKNCILSEGGRSLTILMKIHAITFETDLLAGNCNHACGSQMPVYVSESCRSCGNADAWVQPKPTELKSSRVGPRNAGFLPSNVFNRLSYFVKLGSW